MCKAAILGFGTVGSGVAKVLCVNAESIRKKTGCTIELKYIVDVRDFPESSFKDLMVKDFSVVETDPDVDIVIETIGGAKIAYDFTKRSLSAGKSVVTSNKELVAMHGTELMKLAEENGVSYMYEASTGGTIPIIRTIAEALTADRIEEVAGIVNGTTNYILTQMFTEGQSFGDALKDAQRLGYSELDPTADVEGYDACRKTSILASLITKNHIATDKVSTRGITEITQNDVAAALKAGYAIKLLARAVFDEKGTATCFVEPHLVPKTILLAGVDGVMNGILVKGNMSGEVFLYGAGAGMYPTASAVVSDVIDICRHKTIGREFAWGEDIPEKANSADDFVSSWMIETDNVSGIEVTKISDDYYITAEYSRKEIEKYGVKAAYRILK